MLMVTNDYYSIYKLGAFKVYYIEKSKMMAEEEYIYIFIYKEIEIQNEIQILISTLFL